MSDGSEIEVEEEPKLPENDPTEYLPVMRHHLHEALWSVNMALSYIQATDLADSYRRGLTMPQESQLAKQLDRSHMTLAGYLGLLDEETEDEPDTQGPISEDE
jgi:hypothetical protein